MSTWRNALYSGSGQVGALAVGLVMSVVLARWLGPEQRGIYAIIVASVAVLTAFANLGLEPAFVYLAGKRRYRVEELAGHALWLALIIVAAVAAIGALVPTAVYSAVLRGLNRSEIWIVLILMVPSLLRSFVNGILLGLDRIKLLVVVSTVTLVLDLVLLLVLVVGMGLGIRGVIIQLLVSGFAAALVSLYILIRSVGVVMRPNPALVKDALAYGLRIYPGYIGYNALNRVDLYMVNFFAGTAAAGVYAVAVNMAEKLWIIDGAFGQAAMPKVLARETGPATDLTGRAFRASWTVVAFAAAAAALVAPWLIPFLYGGEFQGAVLAFVLLLPGMVCLSSRVISPFFSLHLGRPEIPTMYGLGVGLLSVPIYYVATRNFGYTGAAAATSIVYAVLAAVTLTLFVRMTGQTVRDVVVPTKHDFLGVPMIAGVARRWKGAIVDV